MAEQIEISKSGAKAMADILSVVSQNDALSMRLSVIKIAEKSASGAETIASIEFNNKTSTDIVRGAVVAQKVLDYRGGLTHKYVLLYFQRTSTDYPKSDGKTDDKAIIPAISSKPLPVHFASDLDAERVESLKLDPSQNPFKAAFRVDVSVETDRKHVPRFYRVTQLHEVLMDADDGDEN